MVLLVTLEHLAVKEVKDLRGLKEDREHSEMREKPEAQVTLEQRVHKGLVGHWEKLAQQVNKDQKDHLDL